MSRQQQLNAIWRTTHRDYKGFHAGVRSILVLREGGTQLVALADLTDDEITRLLPKPKETK